MWRLTGILGRALPRLLGPSFRGVTPKPTNSDGPQTTSTPLPLPRLSFDRSGSHGSKRNRDPKCCGWKDAFHWMSAHVSPNTLRDAVSWGTLAVLALHLARQIHFHVPLVAGPQPAERCSWHSPLYRFLSSSWWHPHSSLRRHVLPRPDGPTPRNAGLREPKLGQEEPSARPQCLPSDSPLSPGLLNLPEEGEQDEAKALPLEEAVTSIQQLFQLSVAIAFNFLGTESIKAGDYTAAFSYFQKAAERGYSKAQYNVGLCLEHGRGTPRDLSKAILFYHLAAVQGHSLAQYRYARCLLQSSGSPSDPERERAISLLKQAADSGLTEVSPSFPRGAFYQGATPGEQRAVKYLWLAASSGYVRSLVPARVRSGGLEQAACSVISLHRAPLLLFVKYEDSQSRFHLGICYEKGLGVQRNLGEAVKCYQRSAAVGNGPAQERLRTLLNVEAAGPNHLTMTGLKSFSSPSLCSLNTLLAGASGLPHASSTGNLGLLCRSGHLGASHGAPSRAIPPLERSLTSRLRMEPESPQRYHSLSSKEEAS
ncbi:DAP3-binding cell death enhancer 1 [Apodemus speciosus]|uniref:DAP3-binding cell death enhancer 1 n=1 Tax=Apodemus speciosus TaxID=105296 RepID=A0ABQ0FRH0_APOSI